jgi:hypothetical protein
LSQAAVSQADVPQAVDSTQDVDFAQAVVPQVVDPQVAVSQVAVSQTFVSQTFVSQGAALQQAAFVFATTASQTLSTNAVG